MSTNNELPIKKQKPVLKGIAILAVFAITLLIAYFTVSSPEGLFKSTPYTRIDTVNDSKLSTVSGAVVVLDRIVTKVKTNAMAEGGVGPFNTYIDRYLNLVNSLDNSLKSDPDYVDTYSLIFKYIYPRVFLLKKADNSSNVINKLTGYLEEAKSGGTGSSVCNPTTQPSPHYGSKNNQCLKSCGGLGGTSSFDDKCSNHNMIDAGAAYDVPFCCKGDTVINPPVCVPNNSCDWIKNNPENYYTDQSCYDNCGKIYMGTKDRVVTPPPVCVPNNSCDWLKNSPANYYTDQSCVDNCGNTYAGTKTRGNPNCTPNNTCDWLKNNKSNYYTDQQCVDNCGNVIAGTKVR